MKKPMPPPTQRELFDKIVADGDSSRLTEIVSLYSTGIGQDHYMTWDELRYRQPPEGFTHEEWWLAVKIARQGMQRRLTLTDAEGQPFIYALPDELLRETEFISANASGNIALPEVVANPATRDRYVVNSLIEEAITSSQLEGAATTRAVAKDMIRSGRPPRDRSERMILNNYRAMQRIGELRGETLTLDLIRQIHRIVTEGTLENPDSAGRFQGPSEERVGVYLDGNLLHTPPPAHQLEARLVRLCEFANSDKQGPYLPKVLRSLVIHFMIGYEHPFEDGNGRTARALFYWSMLNQEFWLTEFLSVSRILKLAPSKYARSFLYTESDENDLTYFFIYQLKVLRRSINELHDYLAAKMAELRAFRESLSGAPDVFNPRQIAVLQHALANPDASYTVQSHRTSHRTSTETARKDLTGLEDLGLLRKLKTGKRFVFVAVPNIGEQVAELRGTDSSS
jgi:Fic family protein